LGNSKTNNDFSSNKRAVSMLSRLGEVAFMRFSLFLLVLSLDYRVGEG
jgi:hypothetical protein